MTFDATCLTYGAGVSMTKQEVFNVVREHLLKQGVRSENAAGSFRYRGPNGLMCAVGVIIPDDLYHPEMEGRVVKDIWHMFSLGYYPNVLDLLEDLQNVHDTYWPPVWAEKLEAIRQRHNLI